MKSERFGVRQCVNVVFRAKKSGKLGTMSYVKNQPVLYIDSATTSTLEQAASTSYAQGGRGNSRLIAWEGDKTVTFTYWSFYSFWCASYSQRCNRRCKEC